MAGNWENQRLPLRSFIKRRRAEAQAINRALLDLPGTGDYHTINPSEVFCDLHGCHRRITKGPVRTDSLGMVVCPECWAAGRAEE